MKNTIKTLAVLFLSITLINCDNDDPNTPAVNFNQCNYQGLTAEYSNNTITLIPEADLATDFFLTSSNGPEVEIFGGTPFISFTTTAVTLNATESGANLVIDGTSYAVNVICQRAGAVIGDEFRFDVTGNGLEGEFCVVVDTETIRYIDNDGDGYGGTTIATTYVAGGISAYNTDCNDNDVTINPGTTEVLNDSIDSNCNGNDNV